MLNIWVKHFWNIGSAELSVVAFFVYVVVHFDWFCRDVDLSRLRYDKNILFNFECKMQSRFIQLYVRRDESRLYINLCFLILVVFQICYLHR